jgi:preprotein translocase subunit Sec61beta
MAENKISMPGAFGGLMRYDEEYQSRFMISPAAVIAFVIGIIVFVLVLKIFFPFSQELISSAGAPPVVPNGGLILSLLS